MSNDRTKGFHINFLSDKDLETLHESSLRILNETGVIVDNRELREILAEAGAEVNSDSNTTKLPPNLAQKAIDRAPSGFTLYERGEEGGTIQVGEDRTYTHTTGGPSYIRDLETGERRDATVKDVVRAARIVSSLDNIHTYSPLVSPTDVVSGAEGIEMVNAAIRNTGKIVENPVSSGAEVKFLHEMFCAAVGSEGKLDRKPGFVISVSPISPLAFDKLSGEALLKSARKGLPLKVLPAPITGATAPVTFAGAIAQQNAELLAGLIIAQTVSPGIPTVLAPRLSIMDMRTSYVSWGTNELGMASACAVQLLKKYNIPSDVYGLSSDAKIMDQQQGYEKSLNGLLPALAGANFLSGAGGLESLKSCSLAQLIIDNEIFGMIMNTLNGFEINKDTIALDLIDDVGPRGDFLRQKHTARYARKGEQYRSSLSNRDTWEKWTVKGKNDIVDVAKEKARSILKNSDHFETKRSTEKDLDRIMDNARSYFSESKP